MIKQRQLRGSTDSSKRSHFVGVIWDARRQKWRAAVRESGKKKWVGSFLTDVAAARAYDAYCGPRGKPVNFPSTNQKQAVKQPPLPNSSPPPNASGYRAAHTAAAAAAIWFKAAHTAAAAAAGEGLGSGRGRMTTVSMCNQLILALADSGDKQRVQAHMKGADWNSNSSALDGLDSAVLVCRLMAQETNLAPDVVTFGSLVSRAGSAGRLTLAKRLWHDMKQAGVAPDVPATNSLLNAYAKASRGGDESASNSAVKAASILAAMPLSGLHPNSISYNTVMDAFVRAGNLNAAAGVLQDMCGGAVAGRGLLPNERTCSIMMRALAGEGLIEEAFSLLDLMKANPETTPNTIHYTTLIDACGRTGDLDRAFHTLEAMEESGLSANVVTWTTLIDACVKVAARAKRNAKKEKDGAAEAALVERQQDLKDRLSAKRQEIMEKQEALAINAQWIEKWDEEAYCPYWKNTVSRQIVWADPAFKASSSSKQVMHAISVGVVEASKADDSSLGGTTKEIETVNDDKAKIRTIVTDVLACFSHKVGDVDATTTATAALGDDKGVVIIDSRNALLSKQDVKRGQTKKAPSKSRVGDVAMDGFLESSGSTILSDFFRSGRSTAADFSEPLFGPDFQASTVAGLHSSKQPMGQQQSVFRVSDDNGSDISLQEAPQTATSFANKILGSEEALRLALFLFQTMLRSGIRPNRVTCTALMDGLLKCGELDTAMELLEYMRHAGLTPSTVTFTSLLTECSRRGRVEHASSLVRILRDDQLEHVVKAQAHNKPSAPNKPSAKKRGEPTPSAGDTTHTPPPASSSSSLSSSSLPPSQLLSSSSPLRPAGPAGVESSVSDSSSSEDSSLGSLLVDLTTHTPPPASSSSSLSSSSLPPSQLLSSSSPLRPAGPAGVESSVSDSSSSEDSSLGSLLVDLFGEAKQVEDAFKVVRSMAKSLEKKQDRKGGGVAAASSSAPASASQGVGAVTAATAAAAVAAAGGSDLDSVDLDGALLTAFGAVDTARRLDDALSLLDELRNEVRNEEQGGEEEEGGGARQLQANHHHFVVSPPSPSSSSSSSFWGGARQLQANHHHFVVSFSSSSSSSSSSSPPSSSPAAPSNEESGSNPKNKVEITLKKKFHVNEVTYAALLGACGRVRRLATAFQVFQRAKESLLAKHAVERERIVKALIVFSGEQFEEGVDGGGGGANNQVLKQQQQQKLEQQQQELEQQLEQKGTQLAELGVGLASDLQVLYSSLVEACGAAGDASAALEVFESMRSEGVAPTARAYTSLLTALSSDNTAARSQQSPASPLSVPSSSGVLGLGQFLRDTTTLRTNTDDGGDDSVGAAIDEKRKEVKRVVKRQAKEGVRSEVKDEEEWLLKAFLVFGEMRRSAVFKNVQLDAACFNALMGACCRAGATDRCFEVLGEMVSEPHSLRPDAITYTTLIKALGKAQRVDEAEALFAEMQQRSNHFADPCVPTEVTFTELMHCNLRAQRPARALALFNQLRTRNQLQTSATSRRQRPISAAAFRKALQACEMLGDWKRAMNVYSLMTSSQGQDQPPMSSSSGGGGVRLDNPSLLALVRVLERGGQFDTAAQVRRARSHMQ
eukprot:CAMPEP_0171991528 /NCGR_PEP_ID=MMETSP0993-20121228/277467_1 /TAXON_ID=483369 /ORGANISM="non described non described, Strain CCMP2098" /LENGTH=1586 /DNA_ID=CAMNT_0012644555 /DNA_START=311 /DNA_END=5071 /DNA_ORIENTATION=+